MVGNDRWPTTIICNTGISAVLWENPIKHASNIHREVFNSFYWTTIHGESHRITYEEILSMVTQFFCIWTSQQKSLKQVYAISTVHYPPPIPQNNSRKYINPIINNLIFLVSALLSSYNSKSPQARVTGHHKQDFSLLDPTSNYKVINVSQLVSQSNHHVCQNLIFMASRYFFLKNIWLTFSLLLWTYTAVECAWLLSPNS